MTKILKSSSLCLSICLWMGLGGAMSPSASAWDCDPSRPCIDPTPVPCDPSRPCPEPGEGIADLSFVSKACQTYRTWESEAKCFRAGVSAIANRRTIREFATQACGVGSTWEQDAHCYRVLLGGIADPSFQRMKELCQRYPAWDSEVACYKNIL